MKIVSVVNFSILQSLIAQKDYFAGNLFFQDIFFAQKRILQLLLTPITGESRDGGLTSISRDLLS